MQTKHLSLLFALAAAGCAAPSADTEGDTSTDALASTRSAVAGQELALFDFAACPGIDPKTAAADKLVKCTYLTPSTFAGLRFTTDRAAFDASEPRQTAYVFQGPSPRDPNVTQWYGLVKVGGGSSGGSLQTSSLKPQAAVALAAPIFVLDAPLIFGAALLGTMVIVALPQLSTSSADAKAFVKTLESAVAGTATKGKEADEKEIIVAELPDKRIVALPPYLYPQKPTTIRVTNRVKLRTAFASAADITRSLQGGKQVSEYTPRGSGIAVESGQSLTLPTLFCAGPETPDDGPSINAEYVRVNVSDTFRTVEVSCQYL